MASDFWTITATHDNVHVLVPAPEQTEAVYINNRILRIMNESCELSGINRAPSPIPECIVHKRNRKRNKH